MLSGSLLNYRRRHPSGGRGANAYYSINASEAEALHPGAPPDVTSGPQNATWPHPGPEGLHHSHSSRRVSVTQCELTSDSTAGDAGEAMVGVTGGAPGGGPPGGGPPGKVTFSLLSSDRVRRVSQSSKRTPAAQGQAEVEAVLSSLTLDNPTLQTIMDLMNREMDKGLDPATQEEADIKMFPTYVRAIPDGTEEGDFLALDLGGTNFRVLWVHIAPRVSVGLTDLLINPSTTKSDAVDIKMKSRIFVIPPHIMQGPGVGLFDHIVKSLAVFMDKEGLLGKTLPLGFTFSFPLRQEGLNRGRLVTWTKGFSCEGVVGQDVVQLFHEAIDRFGANKGEAVSGLEGVRCVAIVNDTTGTLMACAYKNRECMAGLIFGTGTNACYVERLDKVHTWDGDHDHPKEVLVNTEWGAFGNGGCLDFVVTEFDRDVDANSVNPSKQIFEKMISGMYMGEIARLVLCRLYSRGILFQSSTSPVPTSQPEFFLPFMSVGPESAPTSKAGSTSSMDIADQANTSHPPCSPTQSTVPDVLQWDSRGSFYTKYISEIESDRSDDFVVTKQVLDECGIRNVSLRECATVRRICEVVSTRAAHLASAAIAVLLNRMHRPHVTVGVDGSLYRFHPQFHNLMMDKIPELIPSDCTFDLMLSHDGSGKGAALIAAVAQRIETAKNGAT